MTKRTDHLTGPSPLISHLRQEIDDLNPRSRRSLPFFPLKRFKPFLSKRRSRSFARWLDGLDDIWGRARVMARIERLAAGNPGDAKPVGGDVSELRIDHGPGYRVYFKHFGPHVVVLLAGATKGRSSGISRQPCVFRETYRGDIMKKVVTTRYDVAEHLRTPEEMAEYLEACIEESNGDAAFIAKALGDIARAKGMSPVARDAGLSRESLYRALSGEREAPASTRSSR